MPSSHSSLSSRYRTPPPAGKFLRYSSDYEYQSTGTVPASGGARTSFRTLFGFCRPYPNSYIQSVVCDPPSSRV
eukprot:scaffold442484_cov32-Prasinocladus_malaysianus.AAC.1